MTDPKDHDPTREQPATGAEDKTVEQTAVQPAQPAAGVPEAEAPAETTTAHQEQAAPVAGPPQPPAGPPPGWVPAQPQPTGPGGFRRFVGHRATQLVGVGLVGLLLGGGIVGIAVGTSRHNGPGGDRPGISRQHGGFGDREGRGGMPRGGPGVNGGNAPAPGSGSGT